MNALPASIEAYLAEAGFSATEILILKRLLEGSALTLRELAGKTGKSTGVLDQAMRKLLRKNIVTREVINETPKFALVSLQSVVKWLHEDIRTKREMMLRKHQDFASFVASVEQDKRRPLTQYFEGEEGIKQAYLRLLHYGKEMLIYAPQASVEDNDSLRDFRVQYFRQRRSLGIFARVIAHNSPLGRRFRSRDPFEYRETILVAEDQYPFDFEKIIAGNAIACFNRKEKRACLIEYPELASMERILFDGIWHQVKKETKEPIGESAATVTVPPVTPVALRTRAFSSLREFFLGKRSLQMFTAFGIVAAVITFGLYWHNVYLNLQRVREKVMGIAATGALQFDWRDLEALQVEEDWKKPQWAKVVGQLKTIREQNENVYFTYIFRQSKTDPQKFEFVADSHSINPYVNMDEDPRNDIDLNHDDIINSADFLHWPGQEYPSPPKEIAPVRDRPFASETPYEDQWGAVVSGYAPIKDEHGRIVGFLAVDVSLQNLRQLSRNSFASTLYFFGFFLLFILIHLIIFNRGLWKEIWETFQIRNGILIFLLLAEIAYGFTFYLYLYNLNLLKNEIGTRLMSITATAATQIEESKLSNIRFARDMRSQEYQDLFEALNKIRGQNKDIKYMYILRPIERPNLFEFVVDADSNYNLPFLGKDLNEDGLIGEADENLAPGVRFYVSDNSKFDEGLMHPTYEKNFQTDQWGTWISGHAPIIFDGKAIALLGADIDVGNVYSSLKKKFTPWMWFLAVFIVMNVVLQIQRSIAKK